MFGSGFGGGLGMGVTFSLSNQASGPAAAAGTSITNLSNSVSQAQERINAASSRITSGLFGVVAAVSALMMPFVSALKASTEFNFQVTRSISLAGQGLAQARMLKEEAFRLGSTSAFNATEVAEASAELSQSGFMIEQQLKMLPGLANMATAGLVSLKYAAGLASDVMYQFGKSVEDIPKIGDVIVEAANRSNMTVENFGSAIKYFGPTSKLFGISLEEAAGYIEIMANSGMRGSIGTRAFGTALANLAHPTKQASELMRALGFDAYDQAGNFKGLEGVVRNLQSSVSGLNNKQRDAFLSIVFGNEAIQEITQLLTLEYKTIENGTEVVYKGADALHYFTQKNMEAIGTSERVSRGIMNNLKGDLKLLSSAFETLKIKIGDVQEGPLRGVVQGTREWIMMITNLVNTKFGQWVVGVSAATAVLASVIITLGFVTTILIPSIWAMVTAFGALMVTLAPFLLTGAAIVGVIVLIKESLDEFFSFMEGGQKASGFMGLMQRLGAVLYSVYEIWTSWNGETFTLSGKLHDALQRIGLLDFVLNLATWIVRIKEFFKGVVESAVFLYVVIEEVFTYAKESILSFLLTLESMGLGIDKLTGNLDTFRLLGNVVGFVVSTIARPFIILGMVIGTVANAMEFLIKNFKEVIKLIPGLGWAYGIYDAIKTKDIGNLPGISMFTKTENTFAGKGKILPGTDMNGEFSMSNIRNRQGEILAGMGIDSDTQAQIKAPQGSNMQQTFVLPVYLDSEKISEKVIEKQNLNNARQ